MVWWPRLESQASTILPYTVGQISGKHSKLAPVGPCFQEEQSATTEYEQIDQGKMIWWLVREGKEGDGEGA